MNNTLESLALEIESFIFEYDIYNCFDTVGSFQPNEESYNEVMETLINDKASMIDYLLAFENEYATRIIEKLKSQNRFVLPG